MFSSPFSRQKVKNLQKRSKCTLVVLDLSNPNRYIEIRGRATVLDDSERPIVERLGEIYGSDLRAWDKPSDRRASVSITPVRIRAVDVS
jgi:general stress protein 26